jgi:alpha-tubulin suppressor-like RCC1 family protein
MNSLAIRGDGNGWAWGSNNCGQLGDGTNASKEIPTQIAGASKWNSISTRGDFNLAIKKDGTLWAWGANNAGQLGEIDADVKRALTNNASKGQAFGDFNNNYNMPGGAKGTLKIEFENVSASVPFTVK